MIRPLLFILVLILSSCSITQYNLIVVDKMPQYGSGGIMTESIGSIPPGDSLIVYTKGSEDLENAMEVVYHSKKVWAKGVSYKTKMVSSKRISKKVYNRTYGNYVFAESHRSNNNHYSITPSAAKPYGSTPSTGATIHTGPRGGRYYINSNGNKTYIKSGASRPSGGSTYRRSSSSSSYRRK